MAITEQNIREYFNHIDEYALKDLEKMLECADYTSNYKRLAVPIALTCFSLLDMLGFLIMDFGEGPIEMTKTVRNIKCSINYIFPNNFNDEQIRHLVKLFRDGASHEFFPKKAAICNDKYDEEILKTENFYFLNVHPLAKKIIEKFSKEELIRLLYSDKKNTIIRNFEHYIKELENLSSNKLTKGYIPDFSNTTTTTTVSSTRQTTNIWEPK
ncbi:hypothetical protein [Dyadobacter psychrotolerans]|uniref:Uncharacterized protein n=1 Tax=Dyadobacter psychrotolerans TaxID=2541721 RepID=A0A4R5DCR9_9BACT|nr:hypothetical protein [Dyadobacter psychrotolerans]TDE08063.1 hypothetical protein E0F88_33295 [Dyadobacter psychrotolerans]